MHPLIALQQYHEKGLYSRGKILVVLRYNFPTLGIYLGGFDLTQQSFSVLNEYEICSIWTYLGKDYAIRKDIFETTNVFRVIKNFQLGPNLEELLQNLPSEWLTSENQILRELVKLGPSFKFSDIDFSTLE